MIRLSVPVLWIAGVGYFALVGGLSALVLMKEGSATGSGVSDYYYFQAHAYFVLSIAVMSFFFTAWYYMFPKITGLRYHELIGQIHFWMTMSGTALSFFFKHLIVAEGMPRRIVDYPDGYAMWQFLSGIGVDISRTVIFVFGVVVALIQRKKVADL